MLVPGTQSKTPGCLCATDARNDVADVADVMADVWGVKMIGTLKRALDSACDFTSKILDVDESTARVVFAGSLTTLAITAVGLGSHEVARRLRNSSTHQGTDAP